MEVPLEGGSGVIFLDWILTKCLSLSPRSQILFHSFVSVYPTANRVSLPQLTSGASSFPDVSLPCFGHLSKDEEANLLMFCKHNPAHYHFILTLMVSSSQCSHLPLYILPQRTSLSSHPLTAFPSHVPGPFPGIRSGLIPHYWD